MRVFSLIVALAMGNIRATLLLVSLVGVLAVRWKSGLDEHLERQEFLRDPAYMAYHEALRAKGNTLLADTMTTLALLVGGVIAVVLIQWGLRAWSRHRAAKALRLADEGRGKASWSAKFTSEAEVKEANRQDEVQAAVVKPAAHLARDCDCSLYKKLWGFAEGSPIQWEVYQGETEILGILIRLEELERVFGPADDYYHETLEEMLCAADAPHYWRAVEGQGEVYGEVDSGLLIRRPAYLSRSSRKPRSQAVAAQ